MINYLSRVVTSSDNILSINVDYDIQFENNDNQTLIIEPPVELTKIISDSFNPREFSFYNVYFKRIESNKVTRIMDYRGISGLLSLPLDTLSGSCASTMHKVYFGVHQSSKAMLSSHCSIVICSPKANCLTVHDIYSLINKLYTDSFDSIDTVSRAIYRHDDSLFIVNWYLENEIKLSIHGNINKLLSPEELSNLIKAKTN